MYECGKIIRGSMEDGLKVYLNKTENIEDYPIGSIVVLNGEKHKYLGIITNVGLTPLNESIARLFVNPRIKEDIKEIVLRACKNKIQTAWIELTLIAQVGKNEFSNATFADTIPAFASSLERVSSDDIKLFFGQEDKRIMWNIGIPKTPYNVEVEIPINILKLVNLSFGIFGKSGTGKTFLGNILAGFMVLYDLYARTSSEKPLRLLIFDMHSEYALELKDNMGNRIADGVAMIFSNIFKRYTPDLELAKHRGLLPLKLNLSQITLIDIEMIAPAFGITSAFLEYLSKYRSIAKRVIVNILKNEGISSSKPDAEQKAQKYWFWVILIDEDVEKELEQRPDGQEILSTLRSELNTKSIASIRRYIENQIKEEMGFAAFTSFVSQTRKLRRILQYPLTINSDPIEDIIENLVNENGCHITISLGKYEKETPLYMLIANLIARKLRDRIHEIIRMGGNPKTKIVIFLEEAHNFLGKNTYKLSPFGDIARELRKRGIILCVIDQKPGELDPDVVSMLWTNFVFSLTDEKDIKTALMGVPHATLLRKVVPLLRVGEVLVYGQAVNFPVILRVKDYTKIAKYFKERVKEFYQEIKDREEKFKDLL